MPDLRGIKALARDLGVCHPCRTADELWSDANKMRKAKCDQRVAKPVTLVTRVTGQADIVQRTDLARVAIETGRSVNELGSPEGTKNRCFENLEDWKTRYSERAAIREFDANLTRSAAEQVAWEDIVAEWSELHRRSAKEQAEAELTAMGLGPPAR